MQVCRDEIKAGKLSPKWKNAIYNIQPLSVKFGKKMVRKGNSEVRKGVEMVMKMFREDLALSAFSSPYMTHAIGYSMSTSLLNLLAMISGSPRFGLSLKTVGYICLSFTFEVASFVTIYTSFGGPTERTNERDRRVETLE